MTSVECVSDSEDLLVGAASAANTYLQALVECDVGKLGSVWHPLGRLYGTGAEGALVERDRDTFFKGVAARSKGTPELHRARSRLVTLELQQGVRGTPQDGVVVWAQVEVALPPNNPEGERKRGDVPEWRYREDILFTDFLVLFKLAEGWRIISKVYSSRPLSDPTVTMGFAADKANMMAVRACVEEYYRSGHASDTVAMGEVYHERCRLMSPSSHGDGGVLCLAREDFFGRISCREPTAEHRLVKMYDNISKVLLAGPDAALVVCQIAYPPILFTDILSLVKVDGSRWWIVCKTSVSASIPSE